MFIKAIFLTIALPMDWSLNYLCDLKDVLTLNMTLATASDSFNSSIEIVLPARELISILFRLKF